MKQQIIKVVYLDGTVNEKKNIEPLKALEDRSKQWENVKKYHYQFEKFENEILSDLNQDTVEKYAVNEFGLISEDEVNQSEKQICDFDDHEIMEEVIGRKLFGNYDNSIISEKFIERFCKIMERENHINLDSLLTNLEKKLKI